MGLNTKDLQTTGDFLFIYVTREFSDTIILKVKSYHSVTIWFYELWRITQVPPHRPEDSKKIIATQQKSNLF